jgi:cation diffusion facilitator CzcD-associated flavoprotein CzcO
MVESVDTVIIGAGPAGLAVSACLRARGAPFVVLEQADAVGSTWRRHYERLHLHTIKQLSALPRLPWPAEVALYPSRRDVVAYLDAYARRFQIEPRFGQTVTRAWPEAGGWVVRATAGELRCRALVIASGYNRVAKVPEWPGRDSYGGAVLHSSAYRSGDAFRGRRALVVGLGNSGGEIALDLWESGAEVSLAVRSPVHVVPRDLFGLPAQVNSLYGLGRLPVALADRLALAVLDRAVGDLAPWGLRRPAVGPARQVVEQGRIPLIDIGTVALIKQGKIRVVPGPRAYTATGVVLTDGRELPADLVVLATGYRPGLDAFLEGAADLVDERGYPRWHGAAVPGAPGLYFLGFRNPLTGALHDIAREAERIAAALTRT